MNTRFSVALLAIGMQYISLWAMADEIEMTTLSSPVFAIISACAYPHTLLKPAQLDSVLTHLKNPAYWADAQRRIRNDYPEGVQRFSEFTRIIEAKKRAALGAALANS